MFTMLARWLLGTVLVSWRYLWTTIPLHREDSAGGSDDALPPMLPDEFLDEQVQLASGGVGPMFHRRVWVNIADSRLSAEELLAAVLSGFGRFVPREVVGIHRKARGRLQPGEVFVVQMPGPWNGPVRVVQADPGCLRLATLQGHLEAGQIRFRAFRSADVVVFEVESWARCATAMVHLLYVRLRLAKEIQFNMWVRFCLSAVKASRGRLVDGVHVTTRTLAADAVPLNEPEPAHPGGPAQ
jgi:hypothetical protein